VFSKILIANRGEIACRIIRTARQMGIATVAVYSEADKQALHIEAADEAVLIGPAPARESYLNGGKIIEAAARCRAKAIHPGYGFLSENAAFAELCSAAGVTFIGPPAAAIRAMGDKAQAKSLMNSAGVPLVPGYHGADQRLTILAEQAQIIGFPVLIKAAAGGGGKGMRIVSQPSGFEAALGSAKREALSAFGDDRVLLEKYFPTSRHIEVQIFADSRGNVVHVFDRDCSIQRRHQKVIEEAPAPGLSPAFRGRMRDAAIEAARAVNYIGAGTVEFLVPAEEEEFYFLEMNTRLQVEHPVTEMITGIDLVEWQIRVAAGDPLPLRQGAIAARGTAIEARLYAEDPSRDFMPQSGRIRYLDFPQAGAHVRIETGVRSGDTIPVDYDPLIAKIITWDEDRAQAVGRLNSALARTSIAGLITNLNFLRAIAAAPDFGGGLPDTQLLSRLGSHDIAPGEAANTETVAIAVIGILCSWAADALWRAERSPDRWSPWHDVSGWRVNDRAQETLRLIEVFSGEKRDHTVEISYLGNGWSLVLGGVVFAQASGALAADGALMAELDGYRQKAIFFKNKSDILLVIKGAAKHFALPGLAASAASQEDKKGHVTAPMPGRIAALLAEPGTFVTVNQPVLILEAMKMEHILTAPMDGVVKEFLYKLGSQVQEGDELLTFELNSIPGSGS